MSKKFKKNLNFSQSSTMRETPEKTETAQYLLWASVFPKVFLVVLDWKKVKFFFKVFWT